MMEEMNLLPQREDVLDNEEALLRGLIEAGRFKQDLHETVEIRRDGKKLFAFAVRSLSEDEVEVCRQKATKLHPNPAGRKLPPVEGKTDWVKYRSWKIYLATLDREKLWDNKAFQQQFGVLTGVDMIDMVMRPGEKDAVCTVVDRLCGADEDEGPTLEEFAKN